MQVLSTTACTEPLYQNRRPTRRRATSIVHRLFIDLAQLPPGFVDRFSDDVRCLNAELSIEPSQRIAITTRHRGHLRLESPIEQPSLPRHRFSLPRNPATMPPLLTEPTPLFHLTPWSEKRNPLQNRLGRQFGAVQSVIRWDGSNSGLRFRAPQD
jgi:hypothetical protein